MVSDPNPAWMRMMRCPHCQRRRNDPAGRRKGIDSFDARAARGERTGTALNPVQAPTDIVFLVVLWHFRYKLSLRDLAEMFLIRGLPMRRCGTGKQSWRRC